MKDEKWFEDIALDLDDAVDDETALLNQDRTIEIIKRIYTQGRADQNEADAKIIIRLPFELIGGAGADAKLDILARIRAAGPEVGE